MPKAAMWGAADGRSPRLGDPLAMRILVPASAEPALEPGAVPSVASLARLADGNELVVLTGTGRQAATLALALRNELPDRDVVTVLLQAVTSADDPDFVAAPAPQAIAALPSIRLLLEAGSLVVCATGCVAGVLDGSGEMRAVETMVDRHRTAALLARRLDAELLSCRELTRGSPAAV